MKRFTKNFSWKTPIIKVNSIPIARDNDDDDADEKNQERTPLAQAPPASLPPSASKASSITAVERDVYNLEPIVHTHGWKPETMQSPVLVALAVASLLIAALLEVLAQKSAAEGALSIVPTADDIPGLVGFGYLYLPTIVAVLYSLAWNWVDLDVKRMQPWLELSRKEGATGRDSLFLDYPVDFVAFVPFKAARRKHWAVFYSGTIMTIIFFILTPMQGAVFGTGPVLTSRQVNMTYSSQLMDAADQAEALDQSILNAGYAITWLDQDYPPYTTPDYALLPFRPPQSTAGAANWTGRTVKYWTDLHCWPAQIDLYPGAGTGQGPVMADFLDGRGCNASGLIAMNSVAGSLYPNKLQYIGYQGSAWADYSLVCPTCGEAAWNEFLAIWAHYANDTGRTDVRASFCETRYFKQNVSATVSRADQRPVAGSIRPLGPAEALLDREFNTSAFQYLLGAGVSSVEKTREYPFTKLLEHFYRVEAMGVEYPLSPMVGFALGLKNYTMNQYANETVMEAAFRSAHRTIFSVAMQRLLVNATSELEAAAENQGHLHFARYGVVVSRLFSALVEAFLGVVAVLAMLLLWTSCRSTSLLSDEPSSLGTLVKLVQNEPEILDLFSGKGHLPDEALRRILGGFRYRLRCGCHCATASATICVNGRPDYDIDDDDDEEEKSSRGLKELKLSSAGFFAPIKPLALRKTAGTLFMAILLGAIATLIYLKQQSDLLQGLALPSSNFEVNLFLTNYLPTFFSTLVEPFWVLLNRYLCILQPFYDLTKPRRRASSSLKTTYTALPPQLTFWPALRSKHFLLAAVCVTALLGNVLAVGLGAVFNEMPRRATYPHRFHEQYRLQINESGLLQFYHTVIPRKTSSYDDPYYIVMANMSYGTRLPPWMTSEHAFLPLTISALAGGKSPAPTDTFVAETYGIGVDPDCTAMGPYATKSLPPAVDLPFGRTNNTANGCSPRYTPESPFLNTTLYKMPEGASAVEIADVLSTPNEPARCDETLVVGWTRATLRNRTVVDGGMKTSLVVCNPVARIARFRVTFDAAGHVQAATPVSAFNETWPYRNESLNRAPILSELNQAFQDRNLHWHNDTIARDWLGYLLKLRTASDAVLDPAAAVPDPKAMRPVVEDLYRMIFLTYMNLNPYIFETADDTKDPHGATLAGTTTTEETRVFVSTSAFVVSMAVMGIYVVMAAVYYGWGVAIFLPRMPSTVGSVLAYVAPSSLTEEDVDEVVRGRGARAHRRLRFGRFVGHDGKAQVGIEFADRSIPLATSTLSARLRGERFKRLGKSAKYDDWL